ncbi:glycine betaine/L-proline ABC transporter permease ProW [Acidovorax soli]|uniref:glycine betaine/L-proline ABC transporter permease ProW n=1 Tax=Acidovorax soli TaxID=592050 RepID=UPI0032B22FE5
MNDALSTPETSALPPPADTDPWATASESSPAVTPWDQPAAALDAPALTTPADSTNPWGAAPADTATAADSSWLDAPAQATTISSAGSDAATDAWQAGPLWDGSLPVQAWINEGLGWVVQNFRPFFQTVRAPIDGTLTWVEGLLTSVPTLAMVALMGLLAWQFAGRAIALGTVAALLLVALLGIWSDAMVTLSLVLTSLAFCIVIGLPLGIVLAASDRAQRWMRPFLDAMQTTPAFVYLVPVVMLFGIGNVPGVIVTIVFALPPLVRLTNLGLRQVRPDLIEAARAYGASPWQMLVKVQLPLALPSIMAGINQALMLSLSMVVIASMIAVGGLGQMVLRGIGRLDMGLATVGGLGIVLLAVMLDRITQAMGQPRRGVRHWWQTGPAGMAWRLLRRATAPTTTATSAPATSAPPEATARLAPARR